MNIAIIPARGGSKRIPKKNIRNFLGNDYKNILDVGCGTGYNLIRIISSDKEAHGIDISKTIIEKSKKKYPICMMISKLKSNHFSRH